MPRYKLDLCGLNISFKTDADAQRIDAAQEYIEEQYRELTRHTGDATKEKVLIFLLLSLADDYLVNKSKLREQEEKIEEILEKTEEIG